MQSSEIKQKTQTLQARLRQGNPLIMGVVNMTPDSFYDGGKNNDPDRCLRHIEEMIQSGADIIDLGAESSRPGADSVSADEEFERLSPILTRFKENFDTILSIDTTKSAVAKAALALGADIINDISAGSMDPNMMPVVASYKAGMVLMHMQGSPKTMQNAPTYTDVVENVRSHLSNQIQKAKEIGVEDLMIDPGIGFGKSVSDNIALLKHLDVFVSLGYPVLIGTSNKSFIGALTGAEVTDRLPGTIASNLLALSYGASIFRVHNVKAFKQALDVSKAIMDAP